MPVAYTLTLASERPFPDASFKQLHGLGCRLLDQPGDPQHTAQRKPFALWPPAVGPDRSTVRWRINLLARDGEAEARLRRTLTGELRLCSTPLRLVGVERDDQPYESLRATGGRWDADLRFLSPTYFSRSGRDYLLPDPQLIVRTLAGRWNEHAGAGLAASVDEVAALTRTVLLKAHDVRTVRIAGKHGRTRTGFVGQVRLGLPRDERETGTGTAARLLGTLLAFAPYCGLGASTTHGLGAVSVHPVHG